MFQLSDTELGYLVALVRQDISRHQKSIERFKPRKGQDPKEADEVLAMFRWKQNFRAMVAAKLRLMGEVL